MLEFAPDLDGRSSFIDEAQVSEESELSQPRMSFEQIGLFTGGALDLPELGGLELVVDGTTRMSRGLCRLDWACSFHRAQRHSDPEFDEEFRCDFLRPS